MKETRKDSRDKGLNRPKCFSITARDEQLLVTISKRLCLSQSELSRRALRIGLKTLDRVELPGSEISSTSE